MHLVSCIRFYLPAIVLLFSFSCTSNTHNAAGVELAMNQYDRLIQKMDTDSIALLYTIDGDLGTMAHGRDSIRKFLAGFANYKVLSQVSHSNSVKISGDSAVQEGNYQQTVIVPGKDTVTVKGTYKALWMETDHGWLIKRMETKTL